MCSAPPIETIQTPVTKLFGTKHPIILAGMNQAAGCELAAAVSNAGGLGVVGGLSFTPEGLKNEIGKLKGYLRDQSLPFGVDLALPQVGGSARKTNHDYTHGKLPELIDVISTGGAKLFVSAVGVPPKWAVEKLHAAGVVVMNMVGAPKHVQKALDAGVDMICCQGSEGGGHTGEIATSILVPACVDILKGKTSSFTGQPIWIVAGGGIADGRGLAMSLCMGAQAVWVGTRFVNATEAAAPSRLQQAIIKASPTDTIRTLIVSGRPLRVYKSPYVMDWESNRHQEIHELTSKGIIPMQWHMEQLENKGALDSETMIEMFPLLMGQVAGNIDDVKSAADIVNEMVTTAVATIRGLKKQVASVSGSARL
ncbi:nitronate monooxygenase [Synchytrium endobioticum]|uniref:Nitronate monooxygenase n=1 Tax=Synchytrium endobioticum TaxID=286115 RepID=A0A507DIC5_9FUNG|nr:nitronate monooxygenase [Synchytrium endobioticum]TPX51317.1 nitronate monooxygenase [Synchytrium endobioticum]